MSIIDGIVVPVKPDDMREFQVDNDPFQDEYAGIFEVLARVLWKGHPRKPGRLIVYTEPEKGCLCLSDKETGQVTFHVAATIMEALEGLEKRLQQGSCDWRKDRRWRAPG